MKNLILSIMLLTACPFVRAEETKQGDLFDEISKQLPAGWTAKYPNLKDSFILRIDEVQDIPAWTSGPNIRYTVLVEDEPVCRVEVCRRYWSYWIYGGHQRLKDS